MVTKKKLLSSEEIINGNISSKEKPWLEQELAECKFKDVRLGKMFRALVERLWKGVGESVRNQKIGKELFVKKVKATWCKMAM